MRHTPLTMTPGAIIGYRKDGRPIRPIAGGAEPAPEAPPTPASAAEPPTLTPPAAPAPTAPEPSAQQQPETGQEPPATQQPAASVDELPGWAQKHLKELRTEAAANRARAKETADALSAFQAEQAKQRDAFARALGLVSDEPPTAEQLTEQLNATKAERDAEQQRARQTAVELAVHRAAVAQQVDANALLDSRTVVSALDGLDPSGPDFSQKVSDLIAASVEQQPRYKLTPPAPAAPEPPAPPSVPKSGAEFSAPPQGPRQWTEEDVARATPSQLQEAINKGYLEQLGFGPRRGSRR